MARITQKDLYAGERTVNSLLSGTPWRIDIGHRYGYIAIDLVGRRGGGIEDTLISGLTKAEALTYLQAMAQGIRLVSE